MSVVSLLAPYFDRYITIERIHPSQTYDYKARGVIGARVIEITMHTGKRSGGSWLYVAVAAGSNLESLATREKLYVGSQTLDRMFRGDGMAGRNFHHAQMREGNGADNLENFLRSGEKVLIYSISDVSITRAVEQVQQLSRFNGLLYQHTKHVGYWFEQLILYLEGKEWSWNTARAEQPAVAVLRTLSHQLYLG
jgi:hypothetical protein